MNSSILENNIAHFANYLNTIAKSNPYTEKEVGQLIDGLDQKIKTIYRTQNIAPPDTGPITSQLQGVILKHEKQEIARLLQRIGHEQDIHREMANTHHITKRLENEVHLARQQKGGSGDLKGGDLKTTNPIQFLSDQHQLAPFVPKEGKIIGVFKSKFGRDLSRPIIDLLFTKLNEHRLGNITDLELRETLDQCVPFETYKEGEKEELLEALKKAFIEDIDLASICAVEQWKQSTQVPNLANELKLKHIITRAFKPVEDRFVNTALLATLYDNVCGTHLFPPASKISVPGKGNGFIQEGMAFLPLLKNMSDEPLLRLEALSHFIDLDSYQRAVVRATELADADLHGGNVALIPKIGEEVLTELTSFKTKELTQFLNTLHQYRNLGSLPEASDLRKLMTETHAEKLISSLTKGDLSDAGLESAFNELKDNLQFEIKLYDVDLTMPSSNNKGVTGGKVTVRDMLLALPLADIPITDTVKSEIERRKEHIEPLDQFIQTQFKEMEYIAWKGRILRINNALKEENITARGLLWRAIPIYGEMEEYIDQLATRYETIVKVADQLPPPERKKRLKELEIEEFRYPALAQEAKNRNQLRQEKEWYYNYDLLGFQNAMDNLVEFMEKEKMAGRFQPTRIYPIKY